MKNDTTPILILCAVLLLVGLLLILFGCEDYEPLTPPPPQRETTTATTPDTSTIRAVVGWGYGNEFTVFWLDLATGWRDTLYQGEHWYKDSVYVPAMEWGQLRIESTDSVYLRLKCTQGWAVGAIGFIVR
jgi:hypothetical protein